jgi:hypothetical protein
MAVRTLVARCTRLLLGALFLVYISSSCKLTEPDGNPGAMLELARHRTQWTQQNIRTYRFDYNVENFFSQVPPARITVVNGAVYSVTNIATGEIIADKRGFPTLDGLFEAAAMALAKDTYDAHIVYDGEHGFPTRIEATSQAADAGFIMNARNFDTLFLAQDMSPTR